MLVVKLTFPLSLGGVAMHALVIASTLAALSPGVAPPSRGAWTLEVGLTPAQFRERADQLGPAGQRPITISAYNSAEANRFVLVSQKGKGPAWDLNWALTPDTFLTRARDLRARGYVPVCLSGSNQLGAERIADL